MNILLVSDKFKGSLSAKDVNLVLERGILKHNIDHKISHILISDGGDGFLNSISNYKSLEQVEMLSQDPLGREISSYYLLDRNNKEAYIELANTAGLVLLKEDERNPLITSTFGTGLQIKSAINQGVKNIYVGVGGSATNDGGIGIAVALGYQFLDSKGNKLLPVGKNLNRIEVIKKPTNPLFSGIKIYAINDVENHLYGANGASYVFGKQKGASYEAIEKLDKGLENLNKKVLKSFNRDIAQDNGSGAAGGAAYGLRIFLKADFIKGTDFTFDLTGFVEKLSDRTIDLIITGEGKIDDQTMYGKLIKGVTSKAKQYNIPVLAVCGRNDLKKYNKTHLNLLDIIEVSDPNRSLVYNMKNASSFVENAIFNYFNKNY